MMKFINKLENNKYFDIAIILLIIFICYFVMSMISNHVGLFYDSVNPDHLGKYLLGLIKNFTNPVNLIYLGKEYHGVINSYVMALLLYVTGAPSVTLLHFINATYGAIICSMVYIILRKCNADKMISALTSILLAISSSLLLIYITQFYVELSGMVFFIFAVYMLVKYIKNKNIKNLFLVGILSGLSCYGYYNYVFFVLPILFIITIENIKNKKTIFDSIMMYIIGFIFGILPYFLGYTQLAFSGKIRSIVFYLVLLYLLIWIIFSYKTFVKDDKAKKKYSIIGLIIIIVFSLINYSKIILNSFSSKMSTNTYGLFERIVRQCRSVIDKFWGLINGNTAENRLLSHSVVSIKNIFYYSSLLLLLVAVIICIVKYRKRKESNKTVLYLFINYLLVFLVAFVIAMSALSEQHFVPMYFVHGIMTALILTFFIRIVKKGKIFNYLKIVICLILIIEIAFNIKANKVIASELYLTGGTNGAFSERINEISYVAMDNYNQGIREIYVFEEWGYTTSFIYLTNNLVRSIESYDGNITVEEIINNYLNDYRVVIVCNNEKYLNRIINDLNENNDILDYYDIIIYHRNGNQAYHKIIVNKK